MISQFAKELIDAMPDIPSPLGNLTKKMTTQTESEEQRRIRDLEKVVAALRQENRELCRNNELFFATSSEHMSLVDRGYVYLAVSDAYLTAHNLRREEIIGHGVAEMLGRKIFDKKIKARLDQCLAGREVRYQDWFEFAGIGRRFMDVIYHPVFAADGAVSGVVVNSRDITELKEAYQQLATANDRLEQRVAERTSALAEANALLEEKIAEQKRAKQSLRQSEEGFRHLFYAIPDAVVISRLRDGLIRDVNDGFFAFTGYSREEALGKTTLSLGLWAGSADRRRIRDLLEQHGTVHNLEVEFRRQDGRRITALVSAVVIALDDESHILCVVRDISLLKETENNLLVARQKAEEAGRAKSAFLANVSHEVRTPLNAIIGFTEIIKDGMAGPVTSDQLAFLGDILASSYRLLKLIIDILDLSQLEAGRKDIKPERCDPVLLFDAWLEPFIKQTAEKGIALYTEIDPCLDVMTSDPRLVEKVVRELLGNACKFTPSGGAVGISAGREKQELRVTVWDTGIGMTEAQQERLFLPFQQGELSLNKQYEGVGLGLVLCRRFLEMLGGRIQVESAVGEGSRFTVFIPDMATAGKDTTPPGEPREEGNDKK